MPRLTNCITEQEQIESKRRYVKPPKNANIIMKLTAIDPSQNNQQKNALNFEALVKNGSESVCQVLSELMFQVVISHSQPNNQIT
mgnify:CR=1 FL=1